MTQARDDTKGGDLVSRESGALHELVSPSPLRTLRGIAGTGLVWAGLWAVGGAVFRTAVSLLAGIPVFALAPAVIGWAISGFLAGAGFASILTTMERKTTLEELSLVRVAAWGASGAFLASFLVLLLMGVVGFIGIGWALFQGGVAAFLGAASAVGTTKLAKSVPDERPLLEAGE